MDRRIFLALYAEGLVRSPSGVPNYSADTRGIQPSQKAALEGCEKTAKTPCSSIMKNFDIVANRIEGRCRRDINSIAIRAG